MLHPNLASLRTKQKKCFNDKNQSDWGALLKGGIKTILNSTEEPQCSLTKLPLFSAHLKSADNVSQTSPSYKREGGKQRAACWILAARVSVNKGNKLQLHLPQGLKGSLHIKHWASFGWGDAERSDIGRSQGGRRGVQRRRVGTSWTITREEKTLSFLSSHGGLAGSLLQVLFIFARQEVWQTTEGMDHSQTHT